MNVTWLAGLLLKAYCTGRGVWYVCARGEYIAKFLLLVIHVGWLSLENVTTPPTIVLREYM
jgi:hypothetical protein